MLRQGCPAVLWVAALLVLAAICPASASVYDWTLSGGGDSGAGTLVTGAADGGGFDVTAFSGTIDGNPVALLGGQPGGAALSPNGAFIYNNILYPPPSNPSLDLNGLLFTTAGEEGNIFFGSGDTPLEYSYYRYGGSYDIANNAVAFTVTADPLAISEPASLALLGVGIAGLGVVHRRRRPPQPSALSWRRWGRRRPAGRSEPASGSRLSGSEKAVV